MRASWLVSVVTAIVVLGVSILPFLTPAWVGFEQDRAGSVGLVGACPAVVRGFTNDLLRELIFGGSFDDIRWAEAGFLPPCRDVATSSLELNATEASHMRDVRAVFQAFYLLVLVSVVALALTWRQVTTADARAAWWHAVRRGVRGLAVVVVVLGALALVAFDAAFEVFHRLFFAAGSYTFDPTTSRLVQLFPDQFWFETMIAVGVVAVALAMATAWLAGRRVASALVADADVAATSGQLSVRRVTR